MLILVGLSLAFFGSPADYQQGQTVKIMYIHVPAAWLAMLIYALIQRRASRWVRLAVCRQRRWAHPRPAAGHSSRCPRVADAAAGRVSS